MLWRKRNRLEIYPSKIVIHSERKEKTILSQNIASLELERTKQKTKVMPLEVILFLFVLGIVFVFSIELLPDYVIYLGYLCLSFAGAGLVGNFFSPNESLLTIELNSRTVHKLESKDYRGLENVKLLISDFRDNRIEEAQEVIVYDNRVQITELRQSSVNNFQDRSNNVNAQGANITGSNFAVGKNISKLTSKFANSNVAEEVDNKILAKKLLKFAELIEQSDELNTNQKKQVKSKVKELGREAINLAEMNDDEEKNDMKARVKENIDFLRGAFSGLQASSKLLEELNKIIPLVSKFFGLLSL
ncbi:hypothetical protein C7B76_10030 [filamentous cyanobacterium CCP2]|nr:hypothetical protein C7B76_10030 [filamentous cyanobacterium CCP2]